MKSRVLTAIVTGVLVLGAVRQGYTDRSGAVRFAFSGAS